MNNNIRLTHIDHVIRRNLQDFNKPGALTVRPGYELSGGWPTGKQAIVVTVDQKLDNLATQDKLPDTVANIPVDVREATGLQRLKAKSPARFDLAKFYMRNEFREPDWQFERSLPTGNVLPLNSETTKPTGLQSTSIKKQINYAAPEGVRLDKFEGQATIIACASPDAGYGVLKSFLERVTSDLTIAMYDFTSASILQDVLDRVKVLQSFTMVLDHPAPNASRDQTDEQTLEAIKAADDNAKLDWALTRNDPGVNEWIFPSAYHIKVAVGDGKVFWLSSGNFNNSNEPDPDAAVQHPERDRDWHVVIFNQQLATMYKAFIKNDFQVASGAQVSEVANSYNELIRHTISTAHDDLTTEQTKSSFSKKTPSQKTPDSHFAAKTFENAQVSIQPLLTPDRGTNTTMYVDNVLALINSAKTKLYIQTQYIHPSEKAGDADFMKLLTAVKKAKERGVDVRIILSQYENSGQWVEKLEETGLVEDILKLQQSVHNKGIIVDSSTVMISSENWSADGTLRNRDAGVIIYNADIAQYFEQIFLFDWENKANVKISAEN